MTMVIECLWWISGNLMNMTLGMVVGRLSNLEINFYLRLIKVLIHLQHQNFNNVY